MNPLLPRPTATHPCLNKLLLNNAGQGRWAFMQITPLKFCIPSLSKNYNNYINVYKLVLNYANLCIKPLQRYFKEASAPNKL